MTPEMFFTIYLVVEYVLRFIAIGVVPQNRRPAAGQAWLLLIFFLPVVGVVVFALLGSPYVSGRRRQIQQRVNATIREYVDQHPVRHPGYPSKFEPVVVQNRNLTSFPCVEGELRAVHAEAVDSIHAIARAIETAERYVHVQIYIMAVDETTAPVFDALVAAKQRGVAVRVLFDHIGSFKYPGRKPMMKQLTAAGIEFHQMMPIDPLRGRWRRPDLRNHRKLVVIDGVRGFMGSQNMIEPPYQSKNNAKIGRHWIDTNVELIGAIVESLDVIFAIDWYTETGERLGTAIEAADRRDSEADQGKATLLDKSATDGNLVPMQLVPSGPGFPTEPNLRQFCWLINQAEHYVGIVSPYFVPDEALQTAITSASFRGVQVELFVSERADQFMVHHAQRSYYQLLLEAGVRIFTYPAPAVLHTKMLTVDGEVSVIGSSNMDTRSFVLDYEIMILCPDREFTAQLDAVIGTYRSGSGEIDLAEWRRRPWAQRYLDNALRLTAALQ